MEPTRLSKENLIALYRFTLLLKGEEGAARNILHETLAESASHLAQLRNDRNRLAFAVKKLRGTCLKSGAPLLIENELTQQFSALPEPGRSALALHYLKLFSPEDSAILLDLSLDHFSSALKSAQAQLSKDRDRTSPPVVMASSSPIDLDPAVLKEIDSLELPTDLEPRFLEKEEPAGQGFNLKRIWRQPPILAVIIALIVIPSWFIYSSLLRADNFPGHEVMEQLINATDEMNGSELTLKNSETGLLGDWLFSQFGFENYFVPEELAHLKTAGCRVFKLNGIPVAQIAVDKKASFLFLFHAEDLAVKIRPTDQWRIFKLDEWCVAIQEHNDECVMIAFHGSKDEMRHFLAESQPRK